MGRAARLGPAVTGQVRRQDPEVLGQGGDQRQHRCVRRAEAVHKHDRRSVHRPRLEIEGVDTGSAHRPGVRATVILDVPGEQPVQLQSKSEIPADGQQFVQEGLHPTALPGDDLGED